MWYNMVKDYDCKILYHLGKANMVVDASSLRYFMDQTNINMRQCRWHNVVKDYDYEILYHLGKANMVADVWSRKPASTLDREHYFRMAIDSPLSDLMMEAQA